MRERRPFRFLPLLLTLPVLYASSYLAGRQFMNIGLVDASTSISFDPDGSVIAAMGGGMMTVRGPGTSGVLLRRLNDLYAPLRWIDRELTDHEFYWLFGID